ncbi:MAG TPA: hypothetical protein VGX75_06860 [bacterium]|nr:hypothetical protein [bacterium]
METRSSIASLNMRLPSTVKTRIAARAKGQHRSTSDQARRYLELALTAEDNPDLSFSFIAKIVEGLAESEAGLGEPLEWNAE